MTETFGNLEPAVRSFLRDALRIPSVSGGEGPFTRFVAEFLADAGLRVDVWQSTEAELAGRHPVVDCRHLPLAGRPTLVATLPGTGGGRSLLFNAHADTVAAPDPDRWTHPPFAGVESNGKFLGRGACDVKGPLASAVWALLALRDHRPAGDVSVELVPGEEDCVTLGTLTSVVRGHTADACVVLEPTECLPRNASRPGVRFEITCHGRAVHGTVKWMGVDAIALAMKVSAALQRLEAAWDREYRNPLFSSYPLSYPVTVDTIRGGDWQGMVCDKCSLGGYLELLPGDEPAVWQRRFIGGIADAIGEIGTGSFAEHVTVTFPELYSGHSSPEAGDLCRTAESAVRLEGQGWPGWSGFNSGCEAGLRANLLGTPTLVWGPGSLAQAHGVDEFVSFADVRQAARRFVRLAADWCGSGG